MYYHRCIVLLIAAHSAAVCHAQGVDPGHLGGTGHNAVLQRPRAGPSGPFRSSPSLCIRHHGVCFDVHMILISHVARSYGWLSSLPLPPPGHIHDWTFCRLFRLFREIIRGTRDQVTTLKCWAQTASKTISLKPYDNDNVSVIPTLLSLFVSYILLIHLNDGMYLPTAHSRFLQA